MGSYVLDFYCPEVRLALEVDGAVHDVPDQAQRDVERDANLRAEGVTVLRFTNDEVDHDLPRVLATIAAQATSLQKTPDP